MSLAKEEEDVSIMLERRRRKPKTPALSLEERVKLAREGELVFVHPRGTIEGNVYVYDSGTGECLPLSTGQAYIFAYMKLIYYSAGDGPGGHFYRLCDGVSIEAIRKGVS